MSRIMKGLRTEDYTGIESGPSTGPFAGEKTPEENPYGGKKSRKFRGAVSEGDVIQGPWGKNPSERDPHAEQFKIAKRIVKLLADHNKKELKIDGFGVGKNTGEIYVGIFEPKTGKSFNIVISADGKSVRHDHESDNLLETPNQSPVGEQPGGWREYHAEPAGLKEEELDEFDLSTMMNTNTSLSQNPEQEPDADVVFIRWPNCNSPMERVWEALETELPDEYPSDHRVWNSPDATPAAQRSGERVRQKAQEFKKRGSAVVTTKKLSAANTLSNIFKQHYGIGCKVVPHDTNEDLDENLHKWFKEKWVRFGPDGKIKGACARGSSKEGKPKCLPQKKAQSLGKKGRKYAAAKKRREDPNPDRRGPAHNVATKKKKASEGLDSMKKNKCPKCGGPLFEASLMNEKKDACYYKVKSRYKVWPSAYASGALVKCRKKGAKNWGTKSESVEEPLSEKWSEKYKRSINCSHPKGFSQKAHCAGKKKHTKESAENTRWDVKDKETKKIVSTHSSHQDALDALDKMPDHKRDQYIVVNSHRQIDEVDLGAVSQVIHNIDWKTVGSIQIIELLKELVIFGYVLPKVVPKISAGISKIKSALGIKTPPKDIKADGKEIEQKLEIEKLTPEQKKLIAAALNQLLSDPAIQQNKERVSEAVNFAKQAAIAIAKKKAGKKPKVKTESAKHHAVSAQQDAMVRALTKHEKIDEFLNTSGKDYSDHNYFPRKPQQFKKGDIVWISNPRGQKAERSHFAHECPAIILYSYDEKYGQELLADIDWDDPDMTPDDRKYWIKRAKEAADAEHQYAVTAMEKFKWRGKEHVSIHDTAWYPDSVLTLIPKNTPIEQVFNKGRSAPYSSLTGREKEMVDKYFSGGKQPPNKLSESAKSVDKLKMQISDRILTAHDDLFDDYGYNKVSRAIDHVAQKYGDNEEQTINDSDITLFTKEVADMVINGGKMVDEARPSRPVRVDHNKVYRMINALAIACIKGRGWNEGIKDVAKFEAENDRFWSDYVDEVTSELNLYLNDKNRIDYNRPIETLEMAVENVAENIVEYFETPMNFGPGGGALKSGSLRVDTSRLTDQVMLKAIKQATGRDITKESTINEVSTDMARKAALARRGEQLGSLVKGVSSIHGTKVAQHAADYDRAGAQADKNFDRAKVRKEGASIFSGGSAGQSYHKYKAKPAGVKKESSVVKGLRK